MPPSQARSPRRAVAVLAAGLWLSLGRCGATEPPGAECDNGKLDLDRDLPADAVYWSCSDPSWIESTQGLPNIDTEYDPEPARKVCMDKTIFYSHTIPNSGAFRPVMADSGEYVYCPPQRWLGNLHHGATVLLYHPCAPLHERHLLTQLARSCLADYIVSPHPHLSTHRPVALVSWGRTLEMTTVGSSDICDWLQVAQTKKPKFDGVTQTRKYNLLLTRAAELHLLEGSTEIKDSLRHCCEQTISSLRGTADGALSMKKEHLKLHKQREKSRRIRAAIGGKENNIKKHSETTKDTSLWTSQTNRTSPQRTESVQNHSGTHGLLEADSLPGKRTLSDPSAFQSQIQVFPSNATTPSIPKIPKSLLQTNSSGLKESQGGRPTVQTAALQPDRKEVEPSASPGMGVWSGAGNNDSRAVRPEVAISKDKGTNPVKQDHKDSAQKRKKNKIDDLVVDQKIKNKTVDVAEREADGNTKLSDTQSPHKSENTESQPASNLQPESLPQAHQDTSSKDCGACKAGERCECTESHAAAARVVLQKTPRTDEAAWATASLGFLLVLLTLSVLHTRLYRHWRTTPSLYWHDPQQDYDSVADVIRRRLRIAKRRRKRGRRKEYVLLPSSSSSDERP